MAQATRREAWRGGCPGACVLLRAGPRTKSGPPPRWAPSSPEGLNPECSPYCAPPASACPKTCAQLREGRGWAPNSGLQTRESPLCSSLSGSPSLLLGPYQRAPGTGAGTESRGQAHLVPRAATRGSSAAGVGGGHVCTSKFPGLIRAGRGAGAGGGPGALGEGAGERGGSTKPGQGLRLGVGGSPRLERGAEGTAFSEKLSWTWPSGWARIWGGLEESQT